MAVVFFFVLLAAAFLVARSLWRNYGPLNDPWTMRHHRRDPLHVRPALTSWWMTATIATAFVAAEVTYPMTHSRLAAALMAASVLFTVGPVAILTKARRLRTDYLLAASGITTTDPLFVPEDWPS